MRLVEVDPYDDGQVARLARLDETVRVHDDPEGFVQTVEDHAIELRFGGDLNPSRATLVLDDAPDGAPDRTDVDEAVGCFWLDVPVHDNLGLVFAHVRVRPDRRGEDLEGRLLEELGRRTQALGRTTLWVGVTADDAVWTSLLTERGFTRGTEEVRRHQVLADVDRAEVDRIERDAAEHAHDYVLERVEPPYDDELLTELIAATSAINDAPMGLLDFEDEVFDLDRMREAEQARALRGERAYRVLARHRTTGEVAGHTYLAVRPWAPHEANQYDTAVAGAHRGHRLGLALKIEMMRWFDAAEPRVEVVATWNNAENLPMIEVNEALGYRVSRTAALFQRSSSSRSPAP